MTFPPRPAGMTWTEYALLYGWVASGNGLPALRMREIRAEG